MRRNKANCDIIGLAPGFSGWAGVITAIVGMVILVVVFVFHRDELSEYGISMGAASAVGVVYFLWSCPVTYRVDFPVLQNGVAAFRFALWHGNNFSDRTCTAWQRSVPDHHTCGM